MIATMDLKNYNICEKEKTDCILILCPPIPQFSQSMNDIFRHVHNVHLRTAHMPDNVRMEEVHTMHRFKYAYGENNEIN